MEEQTDGNPVWGRKFHRYLNIFLSIQVNSEHCFIPQKFLEHFFILPKEFQWKRKEFLLYKPKDSIGELLKGNKQKTIRKNECMKKDSRLVEKAKDFHGIE
jgi:hypothetical protein